MDALFAQNGLKRQKAKLGFYPAFNHWALRCDDWPECQFVVEPPPLREGESEIRIVDGQWAFFA